MLCKYALFLQFILIFFSHFMYGDSNFPTLRVGMELSYPPFETIDHEGKPYGISVDVAYALGKYLHREVEIENIPFIGLIPSLKTGKVDLIISSLTKTGQRESAIDFSEPYLTSGLSLLINKNSDLKTIEDAKQKGRKIVVKSGTTGQTYAFKYLPRENIIVLDKESSAILEVVQGKADAFIYDQLSVYTNWKKNQSETKANLIPFQTEYWAIGIRKNDENLRLQVNAFLNQFRKEKGFEKLAEKYLPEQLKAFHEMNIPFILYDDEKHKS